MSPSNNHAHADRGYIIPIGGAEEKFHNPEILDRFLDVCGGKEARIGIIPTASELEDTGRNYEKLFRKIGVKHTKVLLFETREDCEKGEDLEYIDKCDGMFLTGGNQLRLSTTLGGTAVAQLIRRRNAAGMHVAGTSAGAAFMPEHMIAGGREGSTPTPDMVTMAPGLGLTNKFIVDQHFRERDRLGRLLTALAYNPFAVGLGLDEDTAAFIRPGRSPRGRRFRRHHRDRPARIELFFDGSGAARGAGQPDRCKVAYSGGRRALRDDQPNRNSGIDEGLQE